MHFTRTQIDVDAGESLHAGITHRDTCQGEQHPPFVCIGGPSLLPSGASVGPGYPLVRQQGATDAKGMAGERGHHALEQAGDGFAGRQRRDKKHSGENATGPQRIDRESIRETVGC